MTVELTPEAVAKMLALLDPPANVKLTGVQWLSLYDEQSTTFIAWAREAVPALAAERDQARIEWQRCLDRANENYAAREGAETENARLAAELAEARSPHE